MKRKIYLLALACAVVGTSVISSCKDTDEDLYNDLKNQLALTDSYYKQLQDKLTELEAKLAEKLKEKGPQGDKGDKGDKGDTGANGTDGKSAYQIAVDNGFTGTEKEWLESLKGEKGDKGDDAAIDEALKALEVLEAKHDKDINELKALIEGLKEQIAKYSVVTGVVIQNVYNPAFGYLALPLGIQTNILMSYYAEPGDPITDPVKYKKVTEAVFPNAAPAVKNGLTLAELNAIGYINSATEITEDEIKAMTYDLTEHEIKVGKVYMTVNPSSLDLAGKVTPTLVTTSGKETGISFSALESCDEDLYFAYTRGTNGFYVADAKVTDRGATEEIHLNLVERAKEIKEALKGDIDATKIIRVTYELLNKICKRKAIQVAYEGKTVTSEAALAAAIVNPMGFETLDKVCDSDYMKDLKEVTDPSTGKKAIDEVLSLAQKGLNNLYASSLPAMIAEDAEGSILLSVDEAKPTEIAKNVKLHAVSYCAETLVPYAYKHIAVVKVEGAADNAKAMKNANDAIHMNCVINHCDYDDFVIELDELVKGATYSLVYSAMDYAGDVRAQRFYFTVK